MRVKFGLLVWVEFMVALTAPAALASEVRVLLPPPAKGFVQEAARLYSREHPETKIDIAEAASLALLEKARSGALFDIVVTTGPLMKTIVDEGFARSPQQVAEGYSVIAFRKGASLPRAESPADVKALILAAKKISLSDPALGGASSNFFISVAKDQGVDMEVRDKAVFTPGGHGADPVDRGDAEFGVAQRSELLTLSNIDSVPLIPTDPKSRVAYLVAISAKSDGPDARNFIEFLMSDKVTKLKGRQGLR